MSDLKNCFLEYFDENEKPDTYGRRRFFLIWDDLRAFAPNCPRNADGSVTRAQAFFADPKPYIEKGYVVRQAKE